MTKSNFGPRGWLLVIYCFMAMFSTTICGNSITNLALPMLCDRYGWNYANMISLGTIFGWCCCIFFFIFGAALKKMSPKKFSILAGAIYVICIFIFPNIKQAWQYGCIIFCTSILGNCWYNQFNNVLQSNWFPRKKGLVVGWSTMALPIGAGVGVKMFYMLFPKLGLKGVYTLYACVGVVTLLICVFGLADYPEQVGCYPDNDKTLDRAKLAEELEAGKKKTEQSIWTPARMLKTKEVWLLGLGLGLQMMVTGAFMGVMVPRMMALGYDQGTAVNFMLFAAIMGAFGSYIVGIIDQKTNPKVAIMVVFAFAIGACTLNMVPVRAVVIISLIMLGVVLGGAANCLMSITSTMWGRYGFPRAMTVMLVINQIIGSCGSALVAQLQAKFNWNVAYIVVACFMVVGILLILPVKLDSIKKYEEAAGCDMSIR